MEEESCLNCNYSAYILMDLKNPLRSIFYCQKAQEIFDCAGKCKDYQKRSIKEE